jgi:hypothetical protein
MYMFDHVYIYTYVYVHAYIYMHDFGAQVGATPLRAKHSVTAPALQLQP